MFGTQLSEYSKMQLPLRLQPRITITSLKKAWADNINQLLQRVICKILQNPYRVYMWPRGGITAGVMVHTMLTHLRFRSLITWKFCLNPWCKPLVRGNR